MYKMKSNIITMPVSAKRENKVSDIKEWRNNTKTKQNTYCSQTNLCYILETF